LQVVWRARVSAVAATTKKEGGNVHIVHLLASGDVVKAAKALGFGLGMGLGSLGAGIGIGTVFGSMIQSVARQPELRGELQGIMWLGFALTEAVVFYGLVGGFLGFVLVSG
jgi:F-type H+-transporting ATPase subunit c